MIRHLLRSLINRRKAPVPPEQFPQFETGNGKRILVVDDEPHILAILEKGLRRHGYQVETAANGQEALDKVLAAPPELLTTDSRMPVMDGDALIAALRSNPALCHLPIIKIFARAPDYDLLREYEARLHRGPDVVLAKPCNSDTLARIASELLTAADRKRGMCEEGEDHDDSAIRATIQRQQRTSDVT